MITKYHKFSRLRHKAILWSGVKVSFNFISLTPSFTYKADKIKIEIKKVNNKTLSIIYPLYRKDIKEILKELKKSLGCGGKIIIMDNYYQINLQGDVREKARGILKYKFNLNI